MKVKFIEKPETLLDIAFRRARQAAKGLKKEKNRVKYIKKRAVKEIAVAGDCLADKLDRAARSVPKIDELHPFYQEVIEVTVEVENLKKALSQAKGAAKVLGKVKREHIAKVHRLGKSRVGEANGMVKQAFGRYASLLKSLKASIELMNKESKKLKALPVINFEKTSVILAGFPNTGKTTLLKRLTGAQAKIASYPFTTQKIELGYYEQRFKEFQVIDTPGLLDRPEEERNLIERKAVSALRHLAQVIVFVLDATETCGYSLDNQLGLLKEIKKKFKVPVVIALNKKDLAKPGQLEKAKEKLGKTIAVETGEGLAIEELKKEIMALLKGKQS